MAMLERFYTSINIFLILLCNSAFSNNGASQEVYDYAANIKVEKIISINNKYFKVDGKPPDASLSIIREIEETSRVYFVDYSINSAGKTEKLTSIPLCDQMVQNDTSHYLRDQIFFKFLFPRQRSCPLKPDKFKIPVDSMEMKFDYGFIISSNITCKPWKYKQELRYRTTRPLLSIILNIDMKKKYKCDPKAESIWAKKLAEAKIE